MHPSRTVSQPASRRGFSAAFQLPPQFINATPRCQGIFFFFFFYCIVRPHSDADSRLFALQSSRSIWCRLNESTEEVRTRRSKILLTTQHLQKINQFYCFSHCIHAGQQAAIRTTQLYTLQQVAICKRCCWMDGGATSTCKLSIYLVKAQGQRHRFVTSVHCPPVQM